MAKKLEAKVKDSYRMGSVMAFSGREYVRSEWRDVPAGFEAAARSHELLDVRELAPVMAKEHYLTEVPEEAPVPITVETHELDPEPKKRTRRSSKKEE